jgi:hypothetical protein
VLRSAPEGGGHSGGTSRGTSTVEGVEALQSPQSRKFGHVETWHLLTAYRAGDRDWPAQLLFIMSSHPIPKAVLYYDARSTWSLAGVFLLDRSIVPDHLACF